MQNKEVMITIKLSGSLAKEFGRVHQRLISTTKEAVHALCATVPGFQKSLNSSKSRGLTFAIFRGKKNIGEDDLGYPVTGEDIHIVPVIIGSKKAGLLQTVLGAVLVVVGALTYQYGGAMLVTAGAGMMAGGDYADALSAARRDRQQTGCRQQSLIRLWRCDQYDRTGEPGSAGLW